MQDPKNREKDRHLGTIAQFCRAISLELRHISTIGKKRVKQQYLPHTSPQFGELGPLAAEIGSLVWCTPTNFNGFRVLGFRLGCNNAQLPSNTAVDRCAVVITTTLS